jgi:hypothetical protein
MEMFSLNGLLTPSHLVFPKPLSHSDYLKLVCIFQWWSRTFGSFGTCNIGYSHNDNQRIAERTPADPSAGIPL